MAATACVVDLDGTLWDSHPWYASLISGGDLPYEEQMLAALKSGGSVIALAKRRGLGKTDLLKLCQLNIDQLALYPGVRDTLDRLDQRGTKMGIVTSLPKDLAASILEALRLRGLFGAIEGYSRSGKANGVQLRQVLKYLAVEEGQNALFVGDREDDCRCAINAGVGFAWASYGYGARPVGEFQVLEQFAEVLDL